jgi:GNAT superfamily N-acetyltransferase
MQTRTRPLRPGEARRASVLLAGAFADDPFIGHFLRGRRRRELALPPFFRAVLHELLPAGAVQALDAEGVLVAVAAWVPPGGPMRSWRSQSRARVAGFQLRALFPRASPRLLAGFAALAQRHPPVPHWYLAFVGVDPRWQRHGLGKTLLTRTLSQADAAGIPCYLETPFPDTRAFYRRLGFVESGQVHPVAGAPPIWTMTRSPAQGEAGPRDTKL